MRRLQTLRRDDGQAFGQCDVALVWRHREARVREPFDLVFQRLDNVPVGVTDVHHADAAGEIQKDIAVDIGQAHAVGRRREHGDGMRDTSWHGRVPSSHQRARARTWNGSLNGNGGHRRVRRDSSIY